MTDPRKRDFQQADGRFPSVAYILLWFPKPSETFIFSEVEGLLNMGWPLKVFSLYAGLDKNLSPSMKDISRHVYSMGTRFAWRLLLDYLYWLFRKPGKALSLPYRILLRRWRNLEQLGENLWAFSCGFHLARVMEHSGIRHIHAPWANGPATAAWVCSALTGIPFSFSARAGDIYPQDGALADKIRAAAFVRSENRTNVDYLTGHAEECRAKIHPVYNPLPMTVRENATVSMKPPIRMLAAGRFVGKKGFDVLLKAAAILRTRGLEFRLSLVGDGPLRRSLERETDALGLQGHVSFEGFLSYDLMARRFRESDLFVMSSVVMPNGDRDGLPTVILEAMAHGLPVVATDVCGIKEVVTPGSTGWLVNPGDPGAIAEAVLEAVSDRDRAMAIARKGQTLVLESFSPAGPLKAMAELFSAAAQ